jgi:hypothetical protein
MGYERDGRVLIPGRDKRFFLPHSVRIGSGAHPASYPMGTGAVLCPGVKRPENEADHSHPPRAEVENGGANTSTPPCVFMAWCIIN